MNITTKRRIAALERELGTSQPLVLFVPMPCDDDHDEQMARIEQAKTGDRLLVLLHQNDGHQVWRDGQMITGTWGSA